jgi:hypothetical protein
MYKKQNTLTDGEKCRLDEIIFFNLIQRIYGMHANPTKIFDFIEMLCILTKCNTTIINSVIAIVLTNDCRYAPGRDEHAYLLSKAAIPVRDIVKRVGISLTTYYNAMDVLSTQAPIYPKLSPAQTDEIGKLLDGIDDLNILMGRK